jgi:hypothetical protein
MQRVGWRLRGTPSYVIDNRAINATMTSTGAPLVLAFLGAGFT